MAWGIDFDPHSNLVDVYVGYLRRKLGEPTIETVRGAGYRLRTDGCTGSPREHSRASFSRPTRQSGSNQK